MQVLSKTVTFLLRVSFLSIVAFYLPIALVQIGLTRRADSFHATKTTFLLSLAFLFYYESLIKII